ncbi:MAG TPA: class I SAM-dependent methyltransferase, partial [Tepidiformaceae bacterium]|nr:class I SAM-dependent methyltransferase [Tepidiformaceae bacterium]
MDETRTAGRSEQVWTTARSYENGAIEWYRLASEVDRAAWRPSYDRFADLLHPGATVLDLGCGAGLDVAGLAEAGLQLVGLDISSRLLALTQTKGLMEGRVIKGDLRSLPIRA